jgi:hypothetical protein
MISQPPIFLSTVIWLQLRRERIAERMKALQELVPNSNKVLWCFYTCLWSDVCSSCVGRNFHLQPGIGAEHWKLDAEFLSQSSYLNIVNFIVMQTDKASMLDEIIDYVKFLQLQVKVKISSCWYPLLPSKDVHACHCVSFRRDWPQMIWRNGAFFCCDMLHPVKCANRMSLKFWYLYLEEAWFSFVLGGQILSMSRLGGAGAVAPTTSDLPAEVPTSFSHECNCYFDLCLWHCELL